MNVVTFETAKRLKDAGFPQPKPFDGLMLYNQYGHKFVMCDCEFMDTSAVGGWMCLSVKKYETGDTFAPTATDILKELKTTAYALCFNSINEFVCERLDTEESYPDHNPAEACAAAWLAIHEKDDIEIQPYDENGEYRESEFTDGTEAETK